jgi:hypothetical protein
MKGLSSSAPPHPVTECSWGRDSAYPAVHRKPRPRSFLTDVYLRLLQQRFPGEVTPRAFNQNPEGSGSQRYVT